MPLPSYHYPDGNPIPEHPDGNPIPEQAIHAANTVIDHQSGYLLVCVAELTANTLTSFGTESLFWEVWSVTTGRLRRYQDFAPAWGHYLRLVRTAGRRH